MPKRKAMSPMEGRWNTVPMTEWDDVRSEIPPIPHSSGRYFASQYSRLLARIVNRLVNETSARLFDLGADNVQASAVRPWTRRLDALVGYEHALHLL